MGQALVQVVPNVYLFPRSEAPDTVQPNIGLVTTPEQTILIDCGNGPRHARDVVRAAAELSLPPIHTVIYTHHHWDHTFGAHVIQPQQIIAHRSTSQFMQEYQSRTWNTSHLREEMLNNPRLQLRNNAMIQAIRDWRDFSILRPTMTFTTAMALFIKGLEIRLLHVGGRHAPDSIVVILPALDVMFLGDCYYPMPYYARAAGDEDLDLNMLSHLLDQNLSWYIDGHGEPYSREAFAAMIAQETRRQQRM